MSMVRKRLAIAAGVSLCACLCLSTAGCTLPNDPAGTVNPTGADSPPAQSAPTPPAPAAPTRSPSAQATPPQSPSPSPHSPSPQSPPTRSPDSASSASRPTAPAPTAATKPPPPTPTAPPLHSLVVTPDGLGPLTVGNAVASDAAPIVGWDPTHCVTDVAGVTVGDPFAGAWLANYPYGRSPALGPRTPFTVVTADGLQTGPVHEITVWSDEIATATGVRAGDSRAELLAAYAPPNYPHFAAVTNDGLSDVYALDGAHGRLLFEVAKDSPLPELKGYWGSAVDTVLWIRVVPLNGQAAAIAASDAGGPCMV